MLTRRGWPRPIIDGWPIPWISPSRHLAHLNDKRYRKMMDEVLCQVCGEQHEEGTEVYFFVNETIPDDREGKTAIPQSNALMHWRCMRLAAGRCPALKELHTEGKLNLMVAPLDKVYILENPDTSDDAFSELFGIDATDATYVPWEKINE